MGDAVSLAANISGIIGLGDVVFRRGKELYELCSRCKNAPASKASLLAEVSASTSIVAQSRIFLDEYHNSTLFQESGSSLSEIRTILTLLGQEFNILCDIMRESQASALDTWFGPLTRTFRWAVAEQTVAQSCDRLHRLTSSMIAALSVHGRRNDIVVSRELNITKVEVIKLVEATHDIQLAMQSFAISPPPGRPLGTVARTAPKRFGRQTRAGKRTSCRKSERLQMVNSRLDHPREDFRVTYKAGCATTYTKLPHDASLGTTEIIDVFEREDSSIVFTNPVQRDVSRSLILMRQALADMLDHGMATGTIRIPNHNTHFISEIFDDVLAQGLLSSADRLQAESEQYRSAGLRLSVGRGCLPLSEVMPITSPWLMEHTAIPRKNRISPGRATSQPPSTVTGLNYFFDFQSIGRKSPLGQLDVQLVQGGSGCWSELLGSAFAFAPNPESSQPKLKFSFLSHRLIGQSEKWASMLPAVSLMRVVTGDEPPRVVLQYIKLRTKEGNIFREIPEGWDEFVGLRINPAEPLPSNHPAVAVSSLSKQLSDLPHGVDVVIGHVVDDVINSLYSMKFLLEVPSLSQGSVLLRKKRYKFITTDVTVT
ncbi:hypothetical protein CkaCkLH20_09477 [Colletotrichum karsti]|uniref:Uncharacterized protein n=1 Tax=Colletotrichum karsti TaxID=1095194 RepID=A0A9P6HXC6_9PEZI|nr:uncharacterized protein CkaCkLH20_09477 [Colletotrichum karsti]KAF9872967.1 hypothetical protein CkaCkLH20_09477 [Colletotrichum karsti]